MREKSVIQLFLDVNYLFDYLPQLIIGRSIAKTADYVVEPFNLSLNFYCDEPVKLKDFTLIKIDLLKIDRVLFQFDLNSCKILKLVSFKDTERGGCKINLTIKMLFQEITLSCEQMAKSVNGRSDGMKDNVTRFEDKERILRIFLQYSNVILKFETSVVCCNSSNFTTTLGMVQILNNLGNKERARPYWGVTN